MKKSLLFITFNLLFCSVTVAQSFLEIDRVRKIKISESNSEDVRKIFSDYQLKPSSDTDEFSKDGLTINVNYSKGKCGDDDNFNLDIAQGKVIDIAIEPKKPVKLKKFQSELKKSGINISEFVKEKKYNNDDNYYVYHKKDLGMGLEVSYKKIDYVYFMPPQKYYSLMCDQEFAKRLSSTDSIFDVPFEERRAPEGLPQFIDVTKLILSKTDIFESCPNSDLNQKKNCSEKSKIISVSVSATNPNKYPLKYIYEVTGGKIIGTGRKVLWDLSDVKAGTYEIMAAADDGCGICGGVQRKTVTVK